MRCATAAVVTTITAAVTTTAARMKTSATTSNDAATHMDATAPTAMRCTMLGERSHGRAQKQHSHEKGDLSELMQIVKTLH